MVTVLQARPKGFVQTPTTARTAERALRYLQTGFAVHLRGPAGTGKTTLALHLAYLLGRPIMLIFGDDDLKSSDLIGNNSGYTRKKVVDNYIHSVVKIEDELRQNWMDSRLTLACREGFTLVYDEFNRSRPEVNNILLSALEEKLLVLPPNGNRSEYIRVHPQFRAILTSNPEEYCGVHATQDALMDRLVTLDMPEPDESTQTEILMQKTGIDRQNAEKIVQVVKNFRERTGSKKTSGLRSSLIIGKICKEYDIPATASSEEFRETCADVLLSRTSLEPEKALKLLDEVIESLPREREHSIIELIVGENQQKNNSQNTTQEMPASLKAESVPYESEIYNYLLKSGGAKISEIEAALQINRIQTIDALRSLLKKGILKQREERLFVARGENQS